MADLYEIFPELKTQQKQKVADDLVRNPPSSNDLYELFPETKEIPTYAMSMPKSEPYPGSGFIPSDLPDVNTIGMSSDPTTDSLDKSATAQFAKTVGTQAAMGANVGAAALNRAGAAFTDFIPNMFNLGSALVGSDVRSATPSQLLEAAVPGAKEGLAVPDYQKAESSFTLDALSKSVEFYGGGALFTKVAALASKPINLQSTTGDRVISELGKAAPAIEAGASVGAAIGSEVGERVSTNPVIQAAFEIGGAIKGGAVTGASKSFGFGNAVAAKTKLNKYEQRAAEVIQTQAADTQRALKNIEEGTDGVTAVEATDDLGLFSLKHSLAREDHSFEQKYNTFVEQLGNDLVDEVDQVFGSTVLGEGYFQQYIKSQHDNLMGAIDDRLALANRNIAEAAALGGRKTNDVDQSIVIAKEIDKAHYDINQQVTKVWSAISKDEIAPMADIRREAKAIVDEFTEFSDPSPKLLGYLGDQLGGTVKKLGDKWVVIKGDAKLKPNTTVGAMAELRSTIEGAKREAQQGQSGSTTDSRHYIRMSSRIADTLLNVDGKGGAWDTARALTARTKEVFNQGDIGKILAKTGSGDMRVAPERVGQSLLGGGRADVAVGARELDELIALSPDPTQIKRVEGEFLLTQFQRQIRENTDDLNKVDIKKIGRWFEDRETAFRRNPGVAQQIRNTIAELEHQTGRKAIFEDRAAKAGDNKFFEFIGVNPQKAVGIVLSDPNPVGVATQLINRLKRDADEEAFNSLKRGMGNWAMESMRKPTGELGFTQAKKVMSKLDPFIKAGLLSKQEQQQVNKVLNALEQRLKVGREKPLNQPPVKASPLRQLVGAFAASTVISKVTHGAQSIILHGAAAKLGREAVSSVPDRITKDILTKAMLDPAYMKRLLSEQPSSLTAENFTNIIAAVSASAAQQYAQDNAEQIEQEKQQAKIDREEQRRQRLEKVTNTLVQ